MKSKQQMSGLVHLWISLNLMVTLDKETHVCYVVKAAENVFPGLFGFKSCLFLMLFCGLKKTFRFMNTHTPTHRINFVQINSGKKANSGFVLLN